jgi:hypothetical protein
MRKRTPALLAALVLAACSDGRPGPIEPPPPGTTHDFAASGTVHTLGGPLPAGLTVTLVSGSTRVSAPVAANGSFSIEAKVPEDSTDVILDAQGGTRSVLPALIRVPSRTPVGGLSVVLVPRMWTVSGGSYDGQTLTVSVDDAFRPPCTTAGDTNCDGFYPRVWTTGIKLWPVAGYPVPVAFDRPRSNQAIAPSDSSAFWTIIDRMNVDAGVTMFRPARLEEVPLSANGSPLNGIVIRVDTTLTGFGAWTNWWWNASGDMYAGLVRPRTTAHLRSSSLMTHELLHTQGFKHSCSWSTVMGGYGCGSTQGLSPADVAHAQLARAMLAAQRSTGAQHGLIAALQGERVVLRNLPVISPAPIERLRLQRSDSISHADGDHAGHAHTGRR